MNAGAYRLVLTKLIHSPTDLFIEILRNFCRVSSNIVEFETRHKFTKIYSRKNVKTLRCFIFSSPNHRNFCILKFYPSQHRKISSCYEASEMNFRRIFCIYKAIYVWQGWSMVFTHVTKNDFYHSNAIKFKRCKLNICIERKRCKLILKSYELLVKEK